MSYIDIDLRSGNMPISYQRDIGMCGESLVNGLKIYIPDDCTSWDVCLDIERSNGTTDRYQVLDIQDGIAIFEFIPSSLSEPGALKADILFVSGEEGDHIRKFGTFEFRVRGAINATSDGDIEIIGILTDGIRSDINNNTASRHTHENSEMLSQISYVDGKLYIGDIEICDSEAQADIAHTNRYLIDSIGTNVDGLLTINGRVISPGKAIPVGTPITYNYSTVSSQIGAEIFNNMLNKAIGSYSHAEGNLTIAAGNNSHAEGSESSARGVNSHAEGVGCIAYAINSHAEGSESATLGEAGHSQNFYTRAVGKGSHSEGGYAEANHNFSHAQGWYTKTGRQYQDVSGCYNVVDNSALVVVGNGVAETARQNAYTLSAAGVGWFAGGITVGEQHKSVENVQADWGVTDSDSDAYIRNKPATILPGGEIGQVLVKSGQADYQLAWATPFFTAYSDSDVDRVGYSAGYINTKFNDCVKDASYIHTDNNLTNSLKEGYDAAVTEKHSHDNREVIDKFTEDSGELKYNGLSVGGDSVEIQSHYYANDWVSGVILLDSRTTTEVMFSAVSDFIPDNAKIIDVTARLILNDEEVDIPLCALKWYQIGSGVFVRYSDIVTFTNDVNATDEFGYRPYASIAIAGINSNITTNYYDILGFTVYYI